MTANEGSVTRAVGRVTRRAVGLCAALAAFILLRGYVYLLRNANLRAARADVSFQEEVVTDAAAAISSLGEGLASNNKPTFVMHIGPHKTGTSYLQALFSKYKDHPAWELDNFTYIGTYQGIPRDKTPSFGLYHSPNVVFTTYPQKRGYAFDDHLDNVNQNHTIQPAFVESVELLRQTNTSVLFVYEDLVHVDPRRLQTLHDLLIPHWDVQIVATYRSFHESLISIYNELEKPKLKLSWPAPNVRSVMAPFDIDAAVVDKADHAALFTSSMFQEFASKGIHPDKALSDLYAPFFGPATIMRPAAPTAPISCEPLLDALLCRSIRSTPHLCQACHSGDFSTKVYANPSLALNYGKLAVVAYEKGWIRPTMTRWQAYQEIEAHQKKRGLSQNDFPLICMPQEKLDQLEAASLSMEEALFGEKVDAVAFHSRFVGMNRSFCSIDTNQTLEDPSWRSFFLTNTTA